jgi:hypothetical protein
MIVVPHAKDRMTRRDLSLDQQFPWIPKWIALGSYQSTDVLRNALSRARVTTELYATAILSSPEFSLSANKTEVNLVIASVADLGFSGEGASLPANYARARALDLELCPAEVGPQLRLRYQNQPVGEWLRIAMMPVLTDKGIVADFTVANSGIGLMLLGGEVHLDDIVPGAIKFVFTRSQSTRRVVSR